MKILRIAEPKTKIEDPKLELELAYKRHPNVSRAHKVSNRADGEGDYTSAQNEFMGRRSDAAATLTIRLPFETGQTFSAPGRIRQNGPTRATCKDASPQKSETPDSTDLAKKRDMEQESKSPPPI